MCAIENNADFRTILIFSIAPLAASCTLTVPSIILISGIHPFEYILEELLPDPKYRNISTIIAITFTKFVLIYLSCLGGFRCSTYLYTCCLVLLDRFRSILHVPIISCKNAARMYRIHTEYYLLWRKMEDFVQLVLYAALTFVFWVIVLLSWICVKCTVANIGHFMYVYFLVGLCILVLVTPFLAGLLSYILHMDYVAVKVNVIRAKKDVIRKRTWENKILVLSTLASHQVRLKFGLFYYIENDFFAEFFSVLLLRCFDAIIFFDY